MPASRPEARGDLGIYVHWPFCVRKCPYCDFNVHIRAQVDDRAWRDALATELAHFARLMPGRTLGSVYFGGGTPSLMAPDSVAALLDAAAGHFALAPDVEVTLESNPEDSGRLAGYRAAGVTRLSLGVQSLRDPDLAALGRGHSAAQAREAVAQAQRLFAATSFDLIYARPGQGPEAWRDEIGEALALAAGHLSLYQLTFEPGTAFHLALRRGALAAPGEDTAAALYELTQESCAAAGYSAYEVSSHAVPGPAIAPQPQLLARRRLCRHRPRGPRPADAGGPAHRHAPEQASGDVARGGGLGGTWYRGGGGPRPRHGRGRVRDDGPAAC